MYATEPVTKRPEGKDWIAKALFLVISLGLFMEGGDSTFVGQPLLLGRGTTTPPRMAICSRAAGVEISARTGSISRSRMSGPDLKQQVLAANS